MKLTIRCDTRHPELFRLEEAHALCAGDLYNPLVLEGLGDGFDPDTLTVSVLDPSDGSSLSAYGGSPDGFVRVPGHAGCAQGLLGMRTAALAALHDAALAREDSSGDAGSSPPEFVFEARLVVSDASKTWAAGSVPVVLRALDPGAYYARGRDGRDGADGRDGRDGRDAVAPAASVSASGSVVRFVFGDDSDSLDLAPVLSGMVAGKVDAVEGMGLSHNDFTDELKGVVEEIAAGLVPGGSQCPPVPETIVTGVRLNGVVLPLDEHGVVDVDISDGDDEVPVEPWVPTKTSELTNDAGFIVASDIPAPVPQVRADWLEESEASPAFILNKPDLRPDWWQQDSTADDFIRNKPSIPDAQVPADWEASEGPARILNKPSIPAAQVNADWEASSGVAAILHKPTIPTVTNDLTADRLSRLMSAATLAEVRALLDAAELAAADSSDMRRKDDLAVYGSGAVRVAGTLADGTAFSETFAVAASDDIFGGYWPVGVRSDSALSRLWRDSFGRAVLAVRGSASSDAPWMVVAATELPVTSNWPLQETDGPLSMRVVGTPVAFVSADDLPPQDGNAAPAFTFASSGSLVADPAAFAAVPGDGLARMSDVRDAVGAAVGTRFRFLSGLPGEPEPSTLYFVPGGDESDSLDWYDEYVWDADAEAWEKVGTTRVDAEALVADLRSRVDMSVYREGCWTASAQEGPDYADLVFLPRGTTPESWRADGYEALEWILEAPSSPEGSWTLSRTFGGSVLDSAAATGGTDGDTLYFVHAAWAGQGAVLRRAAYARDPRDRLVPASELGAVYDSLGAAVGVRLPLPSGGTYDVPFPAGNNVQADWDESDSADPAFVANKPDLSGLRGKLDLAVYAETATPASWRVLRDGDDVTSQVDQPAWDAESGQWHVPFLSDGEYGPEGGYLDEGDPPEGASAGRLEWGTTEVTEGEEGDEVNHEYVAVLVPASAAVVPATPPDSLARLSDIPAPVQADWEESDSSADDYIRNKPSIASKLDVYPFDTSAAPDGDDVLTVAPFTSAQYAAQSGDDFTVDVGALPQGVAAGTKVRDCILAVDATANTPSVTFGQSGGTNTFTPANDDNDNMACEAGAVNVYYISEYAPNAFLVARQVIGGGS